MKPLVVIPARGGSKGITKKNIVHLGQKPLIQYSIDVSRKIFDDSDICVSTDDNEIKSIVESLGLSVPFLRPSELAKDNTSTYDVLLHAIDHYESKGIFYDVLLLLQPTSPFRLKKHIKEAIALYNDYDDMVVSVKEAKASLYYLLFEENELGYLVMSSKQNNIRRQDTPKVYELNGSIYVYNIHSLKKESPQYFSKIKKYIMPPNYSIDIDSYLDLEFAEFLLSKNYCSID